MSRSIKREYPIDFDLSPKLAFTFTSCDRMDLPEYDDTKRMNCPGSVPIKDVIDFANGKLNFSKHIVHSGGKFNPYENVEITLPVIID
jgi:hypothetical protein